jgi:NADH-quinone oxidoreductase subunit C
MPERTSTTSRGVRTRSRSRGAPPAPAASDKAAQGRALQDEAARGTGLPGSGAGGEPSDLERVRTPLEVVEVRSGMFGVHGSGDTSGYGGLVRPVAMPGPSSRP